MAPCRQIQAERFANNRCVAFQTSLNQQCLVKLRGQAGVNVVGFLLAHRFPNCVLVYPSVKHLFR